MVVLFLVSRRSKKNMRKNEYAVTRETPDSDNDATCAELKADEGWKKSVNKSRPASIASEPENNKWISIVSGIEEKKQKKN